MPGSTQYMWNIRLKALDGYDNEIKIKWTLEIRV